MGINEKIFQEILNDLDSIIEDPLRFKVKMNIGDDAFRYLKSGKNLKSVLEVALAGTAAGGLVFAGWSSSLGVLGGIGAALGIVSTPVGWIAGAVALGAAGTLGVKTLFKKVEDFSVSKIPKFLNTPLDVLGISVATAIIPLSLKLAYSKNSLSQQEKDYLCSYLVEQWGYNKNYVTSVIEVVSKAIETIDYQNIKKDLKTACKTHKDLNYKKIKNEIFVFLNEIVNIDNVRDEKKAQELKIIEQIL